MGTNLLPSPNHADEDYIDMDLSSSSNFSSPSQAREFEFQMSSAPNEREQQPTTSPADELFYKGKLLPLHLPPRLQMLQNLLQNTTFHNTAKQGSIEDIPFITSCSTLTTPSESCRVSCELNPDEYFFEWSTELRTLFISDNNNNNPNPNKTWLRKLKLIKQSLLALKLKSSKAYLTSLFGKSACSNGSCAKANSNDSKGKDCLEKKSPFKEIGKGAFPTLATVLKSIDRDIVVEDGFNSHRKSFSGAIKRHCSATTKSSTSSSSSGASSLSSSFSINSIGFCELKRSSCASSEVESSIEGAIAHCKQSRQQLFSSSNKTSSSEVGFCSIYASKIAVSEDNQRRGLMF